MCGLSHHRDAEDKIIVFLKPLFSAQFKAIICRNMTKKSTSSSKKQSQAGKPSSLLDTRVIYCGDNLEQLKKFPENSVDLIYIDPPFNSNRNYEVFWGETKEKRAFEDRHASTQAYIEFMRPRCVELHRVLKKTGSFYYHCDWLNSRTRISCGRLLG